MKYLLYLPLLCFVFCSRQPTNANVETNIASNDTTGIMIQYFGQHGYAEIFIFRDNCFEIGSKNSEGNKRISSFYLDGYDGLSELSKESVIKYVKLNSLNYSKDFFLKNVDSIDSNYDDRRSEFLNSISKLE